MTEPVVRVSQEVITTEKNGMIYIERQTWYSDGSNIVAPIRSYPVEQKLERTGKRDETYNRNQ